MVLTPAYILEVPGSAFKKKDTMKTLCNFRYKNLRLGLRIYCHSRGLLYPVQETETTMTSETDKVDVPK